MRGRERERESVRVTQTQQEASDDHMVGKSSFEIIHSLISEAEHKYVYNRKRDEKEKEL